MRMKTAVSITGVVLCLAACGCAKVKPITRPLVAQETPVAPVSPLPPYSGPKARIAVADFEIKTSRATGEIGIGLREMLIMALVNSKRFSIVEPQALNALIQEQILSSATMAPQGKERKEEPVKSAALIITGSVTEFEPQASGGSGGVGGGGGAGSGAFGGLLGSVLNKAHMELDLRIVDAATQEIVASTRVQGQASDVAGSVMSGLLGSVNLSGALTVYEKTPMEKAIRICVIEALRYITQIIPGSYFKE